MKILWNLGSSDYNNRQPLDLTLPVSTFFVSGAELARIEIRTSANAKNVFVFI